MTAASCRVGQREGENQDRGSLLPRQTLRGSRLGRASRANTQRAGLQRGALEAHGHCIELDNLSLSLQTKSSFYQTDLQKLERFS